MVASWGNKADVLCSGGSRLCARCHNTTEHLLVDVRTRIKLMFVPVGSVKRGKKLVCPVCSHVTPVDDATAAELVRAQL